MINLTLYKQGIKSNYKVVFLFMAILTMYVTMIISMYDPKQASLLAEFAKSMPEVMSMVGMSGDSTTLMGFIIMYLYGFLFLVIPMIVTIMISNRLVATHVDRGSMAYLIGATTSRKKVILTQISVLITFITILLTYTTLLSIITCSISFPGELDIFKFILLNKGLFILHLSIASISFLSSSLFDETKNSLLFGAGIPVVFFLIQMLANMGGKLEFFKFLTIFSMFDPNGIVSGDNLSYIMILILFVFSIVLYYLSLTIFKKRDLSI